MEGPEVHQPHAHHGRGRLPHWIELGIAITALITSISSIVIAVHHGTIMEKLVQANSFPYMQGGFSDVTPDGQEVLSLDLLNRGVGPAHEQSLRVKVDGQYVTSMKEMVAASLGPKHTPDTMKGLRFMTNSMRTRFIPGGQLQYVFRVIKTPENAQHWEILRAIKDKWEIEYCYCSVFGECWQVAATWAEPTPVQHCTRDEPHEFTP